MSAIYDCLLVEAGRMKEDIMDTTFREQGSMEIKFCTHDGFLLEDALRVYSCFLSSHRALTLNFMYVAKKRGEKPHHAKLVRCLNLMCCLL